MAVKYNNLTGSIKRVILGGVNIGLTPFELLIANANGGTAQVPAIGTAGQVLTSGGPGVNPGWSSGVAGNSPVDLLTAPTGAVWQAYDRRFLTNNQTPTSGASNWSAIPLPKGLQFSQMGLIVGAAIEAGGTHSWVALADSTRKYLAVSADLTTANFWSPAATLIKVSIGGTFTVPADGIYYAVFSVTATTVPTLAGTSTAAGAGFAPPPILSGLVSGTSLPPAVGSTAGALAVTNLLLYWCFFP